MNRKSRIDSEETSEDLEQFINLEKRNPIEMKKNDHEIFESNKFFMGDSFSITLIEFPVTDSKSVLFRHVRRVFENGNLIERTIINHYKERESQQLDSPDEHTQMISSNILDNFFTERSQRCNTTEEIKQGQEKNLWEEQKKWLAFQERESIFKKIGKVDLSNVAGWRALMNAKVNPRKYGKYHHFYNEMDKIGKEIGVLSGRVFFNEKIYINKMMRGEFSRNFLITLPEMQGTLFGLIKNCLVGNKILSINLLNLDYDWLSNTISNTVFTNRFTEFDLTELDGLLSTFSELKRQALVYMDECLDEIMEQRGRFARVKTSDLKKRLVDLSYMCI
jgi:hypothetical protein